MTRNKVAYLIHSRKYQDNKGVWHTDEQQRKVYCNINSITSEECDKGARQGLNPALRITMFSWDYSNEEIVIVDNKRYTIYRTYYARNDNIDLYLQLKKGNEDG